MSDSSSRTLPAAKTPWPDEGKYGPPPCLESEYRRGVREGYQLALKDIRERKALQREVMDAAIVDRFAEILTALRAA